MNHLFLWPSFSSPVFSAQATLPAGYSPLSWYQLCLLRELERKCSPVPNSNAQQKPPCGQSLEHATDRPAAVGARAESGKNKEDDGRGHQTPFAGEMIARPAKEELPHHGACKGNGRDVLLRRIARVLCPVYTFEDGIDLSNDTGKS